MGIFARMVARLGPQSRALLRAEADNGSPETSSADASTRRTVWKLHCRVLPVLMCGYAAEFMDRTNIAFAKLKMKEDMRLSDEVFGLAGGIFFLVYAVLQIPGTQFVKRYGARRALGVALLLSGAFAIASSASSSKDMLIATRAMLGAAESPFFPGAILYLTSVYPATALAEAISLFMIGASTISGIVCPGTACLLLEYANGWLGWPGWRWLLFFQALPTVLVGFVVFRLLPEPCKATGESTRCNAAESRTPKHEPIGRTLLSLACRPHTAVLIGSWFITICLTFVHGFFMPLLFSELFPQLSLCTLLLVLGTFSLVNTVINARLSRWVDRGGIRRCFATFYTAQIVQSTFMVVVGGLLLHMRGLPQHDPARKKTAITIALGFFCTGLLPVAGPFWKMHHLAQPAQARSLSIPLVNSFGMLGGFFGPYLFGFIHDHFGPLCPDDYPSCPGANAYGCIAIGVGGVVGTCAFVCCAARLGMHRTSTHHSDVLEAQSAAEDPLGEQAPSPPASCRALMSATGSFSSSDSTEPPAPYGVRSHAHGHGL